MDFALLIAISELTIQFLLTLCSCFSDYPAARRLEHPVTAAGAAAEAEVVAEVAEVAVAVEVGLLATGLPVIFYVEVIPSRNIRPYIPLTGSTTWTTSTINSRPPHTVPTPHYTVIIRPYICIHIQMEVFANRTQELSVTSSSTNDESKGFVKGTRISAGNLSSSVQKRFELDSSRVICVMVITHFTSFFERRLGRYLFREGIYDSANLLLCFIQILYYILCFFLFVGLGGLGPEYLLHAAGPASTLASSEFPFSIDGKFNNMYPLFNVHADVCTCDWVMCAVPSHRCSRHYRQVGDRLVKRPRG